ncbi:MAG: Gfo/Idh/MocA family oxidoreductase [Pseudomonadales bacterium]|nr:Gfo/Idh/MocA family oxidoreductase [Pseudomonadales bacterium]MCP5184420.1 Gfo/Idh/MocA family oxidoreductase [Pseudomonadales bacterium]
MKYAVVGVGNMGKNHARSVHEMPGVELVAVADANFGAAEAVARVLGCQAFPDYLEMMDTLEIDAVSVCVPTSMHEQVGTQCMRRGKHILLEKPIAPTVEQGRALQAVARECNVQMMVGHIERFNPVVTRTRELLARGEIGSVVSLMARRVGVFPPQIKDANIAVDLAIHDLDIINLLLGELPDKVAVHKKRNHIEHREDSVEFFLQYPSASAYVQANWITPVKIRKLNITGTDGYLEMDYINQKIQFYKSHYEKYRERDGEIDGFSDYVLKYMEPELVEISVAKREPLKEEIRFFLEAIRDNHPIDNEHAIEALRIALSS